MSDSLPTPLLTLRFGDLQVGSAPYLVIGMFTASHVSTAERLVASLRRLSLPHALFEVPTVHHSISPKGTADPAYTKASFIHHLLRETQRPVLYLDVDTVVRRPPALLGTLVARRCEFAIMNWLAPEANDAYVPISREAPEKGKPDFRKFYAYSHAIEMLAPDQLICSGAVQLWGPTPGARALLAGWQQTVMSQPRVADDQCLDFAFNNRVGGWTQPLGAAWLPKSCARYGWWIFDEPVIDHPDIPYSGAALPQISDPSGRSRFYAERTTLRSATPPIPRDCIIDTTTGNLYRMEPGRLMPAGRCQRRLWVPA